MGCIIQRRQLSKKLKWLDGQEMVIGATRRSLFHDLRNMGNAAVHEGKGEHGEALHQLRMARELTVWFQRSFGSSSKFDPGPFVPPFEPKRIEASVHDELDRLRQDMDVRAKQLHAAQRAIEEARKVADLRRPSAAGMSFTARCPDRTREWRAGPADPARPQPLCQPSRACRAMPVPE
jgi:hypothetical protein